MGGEGDLRSVLVACLIVPLLRFRGARQTFGPFAFGLNGHMAAVTYDCCTSDEVEIQVGSNARVAGTIGFDETHSAIRSSADDSRRCCRSQKVKKRFRVKSLDVIHTPV